MATKDLRTKTPSQLNKQADKLREEIAEIKRERRTNSAGNIRKVGNLKREIARVMTIIKEQEQDQKEKA